MGANYTPIDDLIKNFKKKEPISVGKESEPFEPRPHQEIQLIDETNELQINNKEVEQFVQPRKEYLNIPPDLTQFGLNPAQPTNTPSYQNIKLPLSDDKIVSGLHAPITSSVRWLATFAVYLLKVAHLQLKIVHGKVVRVIKRS